MPTPTQHKQKTGDKEFELFAQNEEVFRFQVCEENEDAEIWIEKISNWMKRVSSEKKRKQENQTQNRQIQQEKFKLLLQNFNSNNAVLKYEHEIYLKKMLIREQIIIETEVI